MITLHLKENPINCEGRFLENLKNYLREKSTYTYIEGRKTYLIELNFNYALYISKESYQLNCTHCRLASWQHHPLSTDTFHFMIPALNSHVSDKQPMLYAIIHANGYGHLIDLNRNQKGPSGNALMTFWDNFCKLFKVRSMSLLDNSKFEGMHLKVLYPILHGKTWFSKWDYNFVKGTSNLKVHEWKLAMKIIKEMKISDFEELFEIRNEEHLLQILRRYQISKKTITLEDLFKVVLSLSKRNEQMNDEEKKLKSYFDFCNEDFSSSSSCNSHEFEKSEMNVELKKKELNIFDPRMFCYGNRKYSAKTICEMLGIIIIYLKRNDEKWIKVEELKSKLDEGLFKDDVLIDFILIRISNTIIHDYCIYKSRNEKNGHFYVKIEKYKGQIENRFNIANRKDPLSKLKNLKQYNNELEDVSLYLSSLYTLLSKETSIPKERENRKRKRKTSIAIDKRRSNVILKKSNFKYRFCDYYEVIYCTRPWLLEPIDNETYKSLLTHNMSRSHAISFLNFRQQALIDLIYLYRHLLYDYKYNSQIGECNHNVKIIRHYIQTLQDATIFIKNYFKEEYSPPYNVNHINHRFKDIKIKLNFPSCHLPNELMKKNRNLPDYLKMNPPIETIRLKIKTSDVDEKKKIIKAFQSIYVICDNWDFKHDATLELDKEGIINITPILNHNTPSLRYSGGDIEFIDCYCGAREDDGSRIIECSKCKYWMHLRCIGWKVDHVKKEKFICSLCGGSKKGLAHLFKD